MRDGPSIVGCFEFLPRSESVARSASNGSWIDGTRLEFGGVGGIIGVEGEEGCSMRICLKVAGALIVVGFVAFTSYNVFLLHLPLYESLRLACIQLLWMIPIGLGQALAHKMWTAMIVLAGITAIALVHLSRKHST
jgi:hypothetical protein